MIPSVGLWLVGGREPENTWHNSSRKHCIVIKFSGQGNSRISQMLTRNGRLFQYISEWTLHSCISMLQKWDTSMTAHTHAVQRQDKIHCSYSTNHIFSRNLPRSIDTGHKRAASITTFVQCRTFQTLKQLKVIPHMGLQLAKTVLNWRQWVWNQNASLLDLVGKFNLRSYFILYIYHLRSG